MPICQLKLASLLDKLWMLWALCLIKHYQETNKVTSPNNIIAEFGESNWRKFRIACEMADDSKLLDYPYMRLTQKGLTACEKWQQISERVFGLDVYTHSRDTV